VGLIRLPTLIGHMLLSGGWSGAYQRTDTRKTRVCKELGWIGCLEFVSHSRHDKQPFVRNKGGGVLMWSSYDSLSIMTLLIITRDVVAFVLGILKEKLFLTHVGLLLQNEQLPT